jgi:hypothetical protein
MFNYTSPLVLKKKGYIRKSIFYPRWQEKLRNEDRASSKSFIVSESAPISLILLSVFFSAGLVLRNIRKLNASK